MTEEVMGQIEWLYNPHAKPAKELSKHDQQMIQLGWDAHKTLRLNGPDREKMEGLLSQYSSELLAWKSWGIDAVAKTHDLKVQIAGEILALIPDIEKLKRHYELQEGYVVMAAIEEAKKQERERIRKDLHEIEFKANGATDFVNKIMDYIKQALTEG